MNSTFEVSEETLRTNFRVLRELTSAKVLQVVKANAYGHGLKNVVTCLAADGVDAFGIVNICEAEQLRAVAPSAKVFLLGVVPLGDFLQAQQLDCIIPIWRAEHIEAARSAASGTGRPTQIQIKVDTGMGRLGLFPEQLSSLIDKLKHEPSLHVSGIYTHFHAADSLTNDSYRRQLAIFEDCVKKTKEQFGEGVIAHAANSPGFLRDNATHLDMVRLGIAGFGIAPDPSFTLSDKVRPAGRWISTLAEIKTLPKGHGVSYGSEFKAPSEMPIGIVPVGYADGFHRVPHTCNIVGLKGKLTNVIGRVCMDHFIVDLRGVKDPNLGDEVELLSRDLTGVLSVSEIAKRWGTNEYDVIVNIGSRVERKLV